MTVIDAGLAEQELLEIVQKMTLLPGPRLLAIVVSELGGLNVTFGLSEDHEPTSPGSKGPSASTWKPFSSHTSVLFIVVMIGVVSTSLLISVISATSHGIPELSNIVHVTTLFPALRLVINVVADIGSAKLVLVGPVHIPVSPVSGGVAIISKKLSQISWLDVMISAVHGGFSSDE